MAVLTMTTAPIGAASAADLAAMAGLINQAETLAIFASRGSSTTTPTPLA